MREIVEVGLKDFQSHKDTVITFESGFNVIVGASDSGKTAIKRGIESVLYNRYVSAEDVREGQKSFRNYVLFNDGLKITREKGEKSLNKYLIEYPNGEVLELNNFGAKVPQEVLNAHGMHLVKLGKDIDSLNCAYQLSGPFFLQNTAGERGVIIGSIAKTQIIDEAVSDTMSKHREQKKTLKSLQTANKSLEKDIGAYTLWIDEAREMMNMIESEYEELSKSTDKYAKLNSTIDSLQNNETKAAMQRNIIERFHDIQIYEDKLQVLVDKFNKYKILEGKLDRLNSDINRKSSLESTISGFIGIDKASEELDTIMLTVSKYNGISNKMDLIEKSILKKSEVENIISAYSGTGEVIDNITELEKDLSRYNSLSRKLDNLDILLGRKDKGLMVIDSLENKLNDSITKYQSMLEKMGVCPTCYSAITDKQFDNIKNNLA